MVPFEKRPLTFEEQLDLLERRGLFIDSRVDALHHLKHINYYRLSAYFRPFTVNQKGDEFLPETTFNDGLILYEFDQRLRMIILTASKRLEVSLRTQIAYHIAHNYDTFGHLDAELFTSPDDHQLLMATQQKELERADEEFLAHFKHDYQLDSPPIWAACELWSLGLTSRFFSQLKRDQDRKKIARIYGVHESSLRSFLHHFTTVRNIAAHHGRLWNRWFTIGMKIPNTEIFNNFSDEPQDARKIYNTLTMLIHLMDIIEPQAPFGKELEALLQLIPKDKHRLMGFPMDWKKRPLWARALA